MVTGGRALRHFLAGEFKAGRATCDEATARFQECAGAYWEADVTTRFALESLFYLGDLVELARRAPRDAREAGERGNLFASVTLRLGAPGLLPLLDDDSARCRAQTAQAIRDWPKRGFDLTSYYHLYALTFADLYDGDGAAALQRIRATWRALRRSLLLRVQFIRVIMWVCRASALLATAARDAGAERAALLREVDADVRRLRREAMPWIVSLATLLAAGAAHVRAPGDPQVVALLRAAIAELEAADMMLHATAARARLARALPSSDEATALERAADEWMRSRGVANPGRFAAMFTPGFGS
jgi:hypothetical protein